MINRLSLSYGDVEHLHLEVFSVEVVFKHVVDTICISIASGLE